MKKTLKYALFGAVIVLFCTLAFYLMLSVYYQHGFSYNTWINGVYCTGKSINEVNEELLSQEEYDNIIVLGLSGEPYEIVADDIDISFDYTEILTRYLNRQNPYLWVDQLIASKGRENLNPVMQYNKDKLKNCIKKIPCFIQDAKKTDKEIRIVKSKDGYLLVNERKQVLNREKAEETIISAVEKGEYVVDLKKEGCFEDLPLSDEMKETLKLWEKIEQFQDCKIIYQMGDEQVPLDASIVSEWISLNEDLEFIVDEHNQLVMAEGSIEAFVEWLAEKYDTVGKERNFQTTDGETIVVKGGIYGNRLDKQAEIEYLNRAIPAKKKELHTPAYLQMGMKQGKDDIGDTYIEIDMTDQMMYYYEEGELLIETEVVTGNTSRRWGTPEGVNYVYAKQTNRVLRGEGYASPVKFWIPVKGNIGIHDASWRKEYGGEIYQTNGSHGCINTPYDEVSALYEMVEIGTPCVMFY